MQKALDQMNVQVHRALSDLTGKTGGYCGLLLANLGAEVILIEPPGGSPLRGEAPFKDDRPGPERSLTFAAYHTNKRSLVLDLDAADGCRFLRELATNADALIEDRAPGYLDKLEIGYDALRALNPALVMTSITGFGQTGPYRDFQTASIVAYSLTDGTRKVVQQAGCSPQLLVLAEPARVCAHACFHRQHVLAQRITGGELLHECERVGARRQRLANPRRVVVQDDLPGRFARTQGARRNRDLSSQVERAGHADHVRRLLHLVRVLPPRHSPVPRSRFEHQVVPPLRQPRERARQLGLAPELARPRPVDARQAH